MRSYLQLGRVERIDGDLPVHFRLRLGPRWEDHDAAEPERDEERLHHSMTPRYWIFPVAPPRKTMPSMSTGGAESAMSDWKPHATVPLSSSSTTSLPDSR